MYVLYAACYCAIIIHVAIHNKQGEGFFPSQFRLLRKSGFFPSQFRLISQLHDIYYNFFFFFFGTKPAWRRSSPNA